MDCTATATTQVFDPLLFHCNRSGHKRSNCLSLVGGVVVAPTLATLRITDNFQGKVDALVVRSRASQLASDEARAAPYVITSMYFIHISSI